MTLPQALPFVPVRPAPTTVRRVTRTCALITAGAIGLTGCGTGGAGDDATSSGAKNGSVSVMASFYPLQFVAERVGGDRVNVKNLTPPGAEPHDLELSPAQVNQMSGADLIVYEQGFQAAVDQAVEQTKPQHLVDAASLTTLLTPGEEHVDAEHPNEAGATTTPDADHDHGALDPHFWLDPSRLPALSGAIATQLAAIDPDGAASYQDNAKALTEQLTALDADFTARLKNCPLDTFVTTHQAFGYLANRYHLQEFSFSGIDPEGEPSPARMQQVTDLAKQEHLTTLFVEPSVSKRAAESLATDLGIKVETLDPLETQTDASRDYLAVMRSNLDSLATSLGCGK